ncbi:MAG: NUDIX domain-containing protein [Planctomycetota bacterium]
MSPADPEIARRLLGAFVPPDARAAEARDRLLAFLAAHGSAAFSRTLLAGHLTASSLVLDAAGERVLLVLHPALGRWLQPGGHCDGEADLAAVARREAVEETGIGALALDPRPLDVDIHAIPARGAEPAHLHHDTRFLARAPAGAPARADAEARDARWFAVSELAEIDTDDSLRRLAALALARR